MSDITLSVLIPSIPERLDMLQSLIAKLERLSKPYNGEVEILSFVDNKMRSIGYKRDALVQLARGKSLAFVDDDDDVFDAYFDRIVPACRKGFDLVAFDTLCYIDEEPCDILVDMYHPNEEVFRGKDGTLQPTKRKPFHVCARNTEIAQKERFKDVGYAEDWDWCKRVLKRVNTCHKIDEQLHIYRYDSGITAAPTESNEVWTNPNEKNDENSND